MNYITRDITTVESPAIIMHGVNCQRVMQSGVAKSLFMKWPQVREDYMRFSKKEIFLGKIAPIEIENNIFVINCLTQEQYGYDNKTYASISAIKICLEAVINFSLEKNIIHIYSPRIGCCHV